MKRNISRVAVLLVVMLFGPLFAIAESADTIQVLTSDSTQGKLINHLKSYRLLHATYVGVPLVLGGVIEMEHDRKFRNMRKEYMPSFRNEADNYLQFAPAAAMLAMKFSGVKGRSNWGEMLVADAFSAAILASIVNGCKYIVKVERPDESRKNSFPSGHTATAFMTATMLSMEYGQKNPWISMGAYATATATGLMRVANNRHWMSGLAQVSES